MQAEPSRGRSSPPIAALTGVRALLACYIVLFHARSTGVLPFPAFVGPLFEHRIGISLFFILSGFLMAYHYGETFRGGLSPFWRYLWGRLTRIVPLHVLTLLLITPIVLAITPVLPPGHVLLQSWLANLLLLHAFIPLRSFHIWNLPSWYLSTLLGLYVVFP